MLIRPAILALMVNSVTTSLFVCLAASLGLKIVLNWDIKSFSENQLHLEKRTYLISTLLTFSFVSELLSLFLFVVNAESMSFQFVGAMCATGVLNVNGYGWPLLFVKILSCFGCSAWLIINHLDNKAYDYPLIQIKYGLLLILLPILILETVLLLSYFLNQSPDLITSCCGSLFSADAGSVAAEIAGLSPKTALICLFFSGTLTIGWAIFYLITYRGGIVLPVFSMIAFICGLIAIVSVVSLYIYENPNHHCPFCILKKEYYYIGYLLYLFLFGGMMAALGVGVASWSAGADSLGEIGPELGWRLCWSTLFLWGIFYLSVIWVIVSSNLTMKGVWW